MLAGSSHLDTHTAASVLTTSSKFSWTDHCYWKEWFYSLVSLFKVLTLQFQKLPYQYISFNKGKIKLTHKNCWLKYAVKGTKRLMCSLVHFFLSHSSMHCFCFFFPFSYVLFRRCKKMMWIGLARKRKNSVVSLFPPSLMAYSWRINL